MVATQRLDQSLRKECHVLQPANGVALFLGLGCFKPMWTKGCSEIVATGGEVCILGYLEK